MQHEHAFSRGDHAAVLHINKRGVAAAAKLRETRNFPVVTFRARWVFLSNV
jgi:hypothetical protein